MPKRSPREDSVIVGRNAYKSLLSAIDSAIVLASDEDGSTTQSERMALTDALVDMEKAAQKLRVLENLVGLDQHPGRMPARLSVVQP